jgi:hypothetical protein
MHHPDLQSLGKAGAPLEVATEYRADGGGIQTGAEFVASLDARFARE